MIEMGRLEQLKQPLLCPLLEIDAQDALIPNPPSFPYGAL